MLFSAKVILNRGASLEFETNNKDQLWVKVDRKRKIAATTLSGGRLRDEPGDHRPLRPGRRRPEHLFTANTLDKDVTRTPAEALIEVYKKLRTGDPPTGDNARALVEGLFFNFRRYDLVAWPVQVQQEVRRRGRADGHRARPREPDHPRGHRGHRRPPHRVQPAASTPRTTSTTSGPSHPANGELIQNAFRIGLPCMERVVRERMPIQEIDKATPNASSTSARSWRR